VLREFLILLKPGAFGFRNYLKDPGPGGRIKLVSLALFTLALWAALYLLSIKMIRSFYSVEGFGDVLSRKTFSLLWLSGSALLIFSAVISALSSFYLARDLSLLMAAPVDRESIFWARSWQSLVSSAWMPVVFLMPVFFAFGYSFKAPPAYYLLLFPAGAAVALAAGFVSQTAVILLVNVLPARRTRDIMSLLGLLAFVGLYLAFRLLRPEQLVNPDRFQNVAGYLASLQTPTSPMLPTTWATDLLWPLLGGARDDFQMINLALLWVMAVVLGLIASYAAHFLYWAGFNKSQEGAGRQRAGGLLDMAAGAMRLVRVPEARALWVKDFKIFFRDHTQWSQLFLLGALMIIYLYNFSVLNLKRYPLQAFFLENVIAFLNVGLVGLVSATLSLRFAFPSISAEGFSYWYVRSSPIGTGDFIRYKLYFWMIPILLVAMVLTWLTSRFLDADPVMSATAFGLTLLLTPGLCSLGVGLGARFPRFETENLAQVPTGYGGLIYMVSSSLSLLAIIGLSAWPVVRYLRIVRRRALQWSLSDSILIPLMAILVVVLAWQLWRRPYRMGLAALEVYDEETRSLDLSDEEDPFGEGLKKGKIKRGRKKAEAGGLPAGPSPEGGVK
jgi:ABC-2 type transport system permease protein